MAVKRPSFVIDPAVRDRARALRAQGFAYRPIQAVLVADGHRVSLSAVHAACKDLEGEAATRAREADQVEQDGEDLEIRAQLRRAAKKVIGALDVVAGKVRTAAKAGEEVDFRVLNALVSGMDKAIKLERLVRGAPTERRESKTTTKHVGKLEVEHTEAEAKGLAELRSRGLLG